MALANTFTTFGDLARDRLVIEVTCPNCGHKRTIDGKAPRLAKRRVAGARFRCEQCGSVGLPSIGQNDFKDGFTDNLSTRRAQEHLRKLRR